MNELVTVQKLQQDEEYFVNSIVESEGGTLPAVISDILPILAFTKGKAAAFKSLVTSTKNIEAQKEIHQAALESGQRYAQAALYSEARLGDMLSTREKPKIINQITKRDELGRTIEVGNSTIVGETLSDIGVSNDQSRESQIIAKASKDGTLEEVIKKAEETGDMPTKGAVITAMKRKQMQEKEEIAKQNKPDPLPPDINQELFRIAESIGGMQTRISRMGEYVEHLNRGTAERIINDCKSIINTLEV